MLKRVRPPDFTGGRFTAVMNSLCPGLAPGMRDLVDEGDLVKVRMDLLGYLFGFLHMHDHIGILEHRLECLPAPPLLAGLSQDEQLWLLSVLRKCADTRSTPMRRESRQYQNDLAPGLARKPDSSASFLQASNASASTAGPFVRSLIPWLIFALRAASTVGLSGPNRPTAAG